VVRTFLPCNVIVNDLPGFQLDNKKHVERHKACRIVCGLAREEKRKRFLI
jgi:hypothetical protein